MFNSFKHKIFKYTKEMAISFKWIIFAAIAGVIIGVCAALFSISLTKVTELRASYPWIIYFLPAGGCLIVLLYRVMHNEKDSGTNLVLSAIHSGDNIPIKMAPLIYISTVITHMFGGSAGREGAALQLGGSIGGGLGKLFRFDQKDQHIMIMCGMSAAFSGLFGTPLAAAFFSMEVVSVGIMHYSALVPCVVSALIAKGIAELFMVAPESFILESLPAFDIKNALMIGVLSVLCALLSIAFCMLLHQSNHYIRKYLSNAYVRILVGGGAVILLTFLVGDQFYSGSGMEIIEGVFNGETVPIAFLLKMIFTAITLSCGFKGGEIVPSFAVGAAFGGLFSMITGMDMGLCGAVGMGAVFCGVTNCPVTSILICFELFGFKGMPFYLIAIAISYMMSEYYGLYSSQKIVYSKYKTEYINRKTR